MFSVFNAFMKGYFSNSELLIQPAQKSDLSTLAHIHAASFNHAWSDGELEKMLGNDNYLCMVAHPPRRAADATVARIWAFINHSPIGRVARERTPACGMVSFVAERA